MARLGDYVAIRTGKLDANAASTNGKYPFFTCAVEPLRIDTYSYDCECVLVAGNGDLNVKYYVGKFDAYQRTYIIESLDKETLTVPYLYCFLDKYVETLREQSIGGVIKYIKLGNLTEALIPIPSKKEQQIVVLKLNKVDKLIALRKQQLSKLDELVKSQFIEMFGDPANNSKGWPLVHLKNCLVGIESGKSLNCESFPRVGSAPAVLKLSAVTYGEFNPDENKQLPSADMFLEDAEVHEGDLLFSRKNTYEYVGMSAFVKRTPPKLMMPDLIFRLVPTPKCRARYLNQLINHTLYRPVISILASGTTGSMPNISKQRLLELAIPLPPIEVQQAFEPLLDQVDKSKFEIQKSLEKLETLKKALMQKYFG